MANTEMIAETAARQEEWQTQIAEDIRKRVTDPRAGRFQIEADGFLSVSVPPAALELAESLRLWTLGTDDLERFVASEKTLQLTDLADRTDRWHHQLKSASDAIAFSRTLIEDEGPSVRDIFYSPLARMIDDAIELADKIIPDDKIARLLMVPAHQVHALWFVPEDPGNGNESSADTEHEILIAAARESSRLKALSFMSAYDFLSHLAVEKPVRGLILQDEI